MWPKKKKTLTKWRSKIKPIMFCYVDAILSALPCLSGRCWGWGCWRLPPWHPAPAALSSAAPSSAEPRRRPWSPPRGRSGRLSKTATTTSLLRRKDGKRRRHTHTNTHAEDNQLMWIIISEWICRWDSCWASSSPLFPLQEKHWIAFCFNSWARMGKLICLERVLVYF